MDRYELKQLVREVLAEILLGKPEQESDWMNLDQAWERLGYPSYTALYKAVQSGLFREGKEVRDRRRPGAKIARYQIDIAAASRRLQQSASKRCGR